jgi:hypothetical protein
MKMPRLGQKYLTWICAAAALASLAGVVHAAGRDEPAFEEVSRQAFSLFGRAECGTFETCHTVSFGEVPKDHRWEITSVSCYVGIGNPNGQVLYWFLTANKPGDVQYGRIELQAHRLGVAGSTVTYNATAQGMVVAPQKAAVAVGMDRDSTTPGGIPHQYCTIGGYDVRVK